MFYCGEKFRILYEYDFKINILCKILVKLTTARIYIVFRTYYFSKGKYYIQFRVSSPIFSNNLFCSLHSDYGQDANNLNVLNVKNVCLITYHLCSWRRGSIWTVDTPGTDYDAFCRPDNGLSTPLWLYMYISGYGECCA